MQYFCGIIPRISQEETSFSILLNALAIKNHDGLRFVDVIDSILTPMAIDNGCYIFRSETTIPNFLGEYDCHGAITTLT